MVRLPGARGPRCLAALALLSSAAALPAPLLDPSLVTDLRHFVLDGRVLHARGVRRWSPGEGEGEEESLHIDVYEADRALVPPDALPEEVLAQLRELLGEELKALDDGPPKARSWARRWRVGTGEALQCQADSSFSIVSEVRSGRYLRHLFEALYAREGRWTRVGVNLGAGLTGEGDDDPLSLWARDLAARVLMVDGDGGHLQAALAELSGSAAELLPLVGYATPLDVEEGSLGEVLSELGPQVDVLKIDIDSFDCSVLRAVLRRITPSIVVLESQPVVPPPFRFARHYSADYACGVGLHGCSLSYQVHLLFPEYLLLLYTEHDTIFVHRSVAGELEALPPGLAFPWTGHLVQLPADEFDCFRRARSTPHPQGGSREVSVRFLREWALALHPLEAFALVAGNLTIKPAATGGDAPLYSIDV